MKEKLERITKFTPAFDKRDTVPEKNYGIGSVRVSMVLVGEKGAVHFSFGTGMFLPETHRQWLNKPEFAHHDPVNYMGYDVGYHSPKPLYSSSTISQQKCDWIKKPCYCDGSTMKAEIFMDVLVRKGSDKIWEMLEEDYKENFL